MGDTNFYSHGKLLLTGEYFVLDGAKALAMPTRFGQTLHIEKGTREGLHWISLDSEENSWFESVYSLADFSTSTTSSIAETLQRILLKARKLNPSFLKNATSIKVVSNLDFPRNWGLGTSSTLINNIAQWAEVDAYQLLQESFGGSGYDIAAAQHNQPILYQLDNGIPKITEVSFPWDFQEELLFVHLNQKKDSKEGIQHYRSKSIDLQLLNTISELTQSILNASSLSAFEKFINLHEELIANSLGLTPVKETYFSDYPGAIKSLGAWGGDFILATRAKENANYFTEKGYTTQLGFQEMAL